MQNLRIFKPLQFFQKPTKNTLKLYLCKSYTILTTIKEIVVRQPDI